MSKGDFKMVLQGLSDDFREHEEKEFAGKSEAQRKQSVRWSRRNEQFVERPTWQALLSDDQARVIVVLSAEEAPNILSMGRIGGEWKIYSVGH